MHEPDDILALIMASTRIISKSDLTDLCVRLLTLSGVPPDDARICAEVQVEADLRGVHSHGTRAIVGYIRQIQAGEINPTPEIVTVRERPAFAHIDGDTGLGQVVAHRSNIIAIEKAKTSGIGLVLARNSNHYGAAAYYASMSAKTDVIGFNCTGSRKLSGNMAAFGSIDPILGNNPLAYGIPAGTNHPIILDMATGVVAAGKVGLARTRGESIPEGWAITAEGNPTTDPKEASIILPLGPKGSGLSLVMNVLGGILSGLEIEDRERFGHAFIAVDISAFCDIERFKSEIDERIETFRSARPAAGHEKVYYPGEIEWIAYDQRSQSGIPMLSEHLDGLESLHQELSC
jgi:ureidoglycolate dehydrogenase (NAD+)